MIGKFWDALFDYADEAKANGDMTRYEICHEIEDILQKAYDDGLKYSNVIKFALEFIPYFTIVLIFVNNDVWNGHN